MTALSRGRPHRTSTRGVVSAASAAALVLSGPAFATPAHAEDELPVLGQVKAVSYDDTPETTLDVLISVHGVRRVDGATMVYYSAGYTPESTPGSDRQTLTHAFGFESTISPLHGRGERFGDVAVLDVQSGKAYTTLYSGADMSDLGASDCVCLSWTSALPDEPEPGTAYVGAAAVPPIPDDVDHVSLRVLGHFVTNVPVEDGPMQPEIEPEEPIAVGMGWPEVDTEAIDAVADPAQFVLPLTTHSVTEDSAISEREGADSRSLDLSADVLFAFDKASLTGKAKQEIRTAADRIKETDVSGTITVTGHTDSEGAEDYNQKLSERRAESVAKALTPMLPSGVKLTTEGKGESEPIASNETDAGMDLNRRVTITLPEAT
ncbi:OmpA family protein [Janibacter alittae]|uniref:OmpA family protein n=1 Tax=Janibacter alittae TaxID=3115209 RepID=A0ABZ2MH45_9MICO